MERISQFPSDGTQSGHRPPHLESEESVNCGCSCIYSLYDNGDNGGDRVDRIDGDMGDGPDNHTGDTFVSESSVAENILEYKMTIWGTMVGVTASASAIKKKMFIGINA